MFPSIPNFLFQICICVPLFVLCFGTVNAKDLDRPSRNISTSQKLELESAYGKLPLSFEPNPITGSKQAPPEVRFMARGSGYSLFLTPAEAVFVLKQGKPRDPADLH